MREEQQIRNLLDAEEEALRENYDDIGTGDRFRTEGAVQILRWILEQTDSPWEEVR